MESKRVDDVAPGLPSTTKSQTVATVGAASCAAVIVSASGHTGWALAAAVWTGAVVASSTHLETLRAAARGALLGGIALGPLSGVVAWAAAHHSASSLVATVSQYIFAAAVVGILLGATVAGPLAAIAKWAQLRRAHDAPEQALFLASTWVTASAWIGIFGDPQGRVVAAVALGLAFVANAFVAIGGRRRQDWLARVRAGREPRWTIQPRELHEHRGLPPLLLPRDGSPLDGLLALREDAGSGPFRASQRQRPVALVHLSTGSGRVWASYRTRLAPLLMAIQALMLVGLAV